MNKTRLTSSVVTIIALLLTFGIPFSAYAGKSTVKKVVEMEIPAKDLQAINVETINGNISIAASNKDIVELHAEISVTGSKKGTCEELIEEIELKNKDDGEVLKIEAEIPKKFRYSFSVSYELTVPEKFKAECESVNGNINIAGLTGGADAETVNGTIECLNTAKAINAETVNGAIYLNNVEGSVSGEAVNGSIKVVCAKNEPQTLALETVNGNIDVQLKQQPNATLRAETMNGSITIGDKKIKRNSIIGTSFDSPIGNGEGKWSLETVNGSIKVKYPD